MGFILFDNEFRANLSPLSLTKAVADFHFGLLTIKERWALLLKSPVFVHTDHYLQPLYDTPSETAINTWIDAAVLPTDELVQHILQLNAGECLIDERGLIAGKSSIPFSEFNPSTAIRLYEKKNLIENILRIIFPWDIMLRNDAQIRADFKWVTRGRKSAPISSTVQVFQTADIFIAATAIA
ncbi:MAG: glucose-1-phosphate thymidylyltransferase, partial [Sphingobacteriia bacterium]